MRLHLMGAACAAALAGAALGAAPASAAEAPGVANRILASGAVTEFTQWRGRRGFRRGYYGPRYGYRRGYYGGRGALVGAGIAGLATGAIIGGALAAQAAPASGMAVNPDWIAYCSQKYRSFDPASGTYLAYDGQRYACQ